MAAFGAACLALAGCASAAPADHTPSGAMRSAPNSSDEPPASASTPLTPRTAKQLTVAETDRLLGLFIVPSSATRLTPPAPSLPGPAMGTPRSASLVDTARYWRVPMPFAQATDWITAHPPGGLKPTGSSTSTKSGSESSAGFTFTDDHTSHAWTNARLEIGVAPAGATASYWRVDALALWRTTNPARVPAGGTRLAVTVAGGCPASDRGAVNVPPGPAGSSRSLVPSPPPTAALICAYTGLNGPPFTVKQQRRLGATDAARLARLANAISLAHTADGVVNCPADFATATVVAFAYRGRENAALWLTDSGCASVSNGTISAGPGLATFSAAITRLLHH